MHIFSCSGQSSSFIWSPFHMTLKRVHFCERLLYLAATLSRSICAGTHLSLQVTGLAVRSRDATLALDALWEAWMQTAASFCYRQHSRLCCASSIISVTIKAHFVIITVTWADMDHSPEESLGIQFGIHCISPLCRSRGRSSSLCWRYTAGSLSRSHCNHSPTQRQIIFVTVIGLNV